MVSAVSSRSSVTHDFLVDSNSTTLPSGHAVEWIIGNCGVYGRSYERALRASWRKIALGEQNTNDRGGKGRQDTFRPISAPPSQGIGGPRTDSSIRIYPLNRILRCAGPQAGSARDKNCCPPA